MAAEVTVAIPVRNGGDMLATVLDAVAAQRGAGQVEVLICDSGSTDGSVTLARRHGATVIEIAPASFGHGRTRNLLMERAGADHVVFLTQDAVPEDESWLRRLLEGMAAAPDIGLAFGPYVPRPGASPMVARELTAFFDAMASDGAIRIDRLGAGEGSLPARDLLGPRGYFTDANGCVARSAWRRIPFRDIAYAEDHALAHDMLRAGLAKAYVPGARVVHSHEYSAWGWLQRSFDEARALHELYGWSEPIDPRSFALNVWGRVGADARWATDHAGRPGSLRLSLLAQSTIHHLARLSGAALGGRAEHLPPALKRRLSHERRAI